MSIVNDALEIASARADAVPFQGFTPDSGPPDPAVALREQVARLATWAPSAGAAAARAA